MNPFLFRLRNSLALLLAALAPGLQAANPIITDRFTADPAAIVHGDTVYLYTGHDVAKPRESYRFTALNEDRPVFKGADIAEQKGIRDPYLMRGPDNNFYMAMTDLHIFARREGIRITDWERDGGRYGWGNNRGLVLMKSSDLVNWSRTILRVDQSFPSLADIGCAWAPAMTWDADKQRLMIHFTMRHGNGRNRLYYSYMDPSFTKLEQEPALLFDYLTQKVPS